MNSLNPAAIVIAILARAEIAAQKFREGLAMSKRDIQAIQPHPDFVANPVNEVRLNTILTPHRPGLAGHLAGNPVHYTPCNFQS